VLAEDNVVVGLGVEGRVQVDEVHALIGDVLPEDLEVVAKVEIPFHKRNPVTRLTPNWANGLSGKVCGQRVGGKPGAGPGGLTLPQKTPYGRL